MKTSCSLFLSIVCCFVLFLGCKTAMEDNAAVKSKKVDTAAELNGCYNVKSLNPQADITPKSMAETLVKATRICFVPESTKSGGQYVIRFFKNKDQINETGLQCDALRCPHCYSCDGFEAKATYDGMKPDQDISLEFTYKSDNSSISWFIGKDQVNK